MSETTVPTSTHAGVLRYMAALLDHTDLPAPLRVASNGPVGPVFGGVKLMLSIELQSRAEIELWAPVFGGEEITSQDYGDAETLSAASVRGWHGWWVYLSATEPRHPVAGAAPTEVQMAAVAAAILTPDADILTAVTS